MVVTRLSLYRNTGVYTLCGATGRRRAILVQPILVETTVGLLIANRAPRRGQKVKYYGLCNLHKND